MDPRGSGGGGDHEEPADMECTKRQLFRLVMKAKWEEVIKAYHDYPATHKLKLTAAEDTALHVAVSEGIKDVVEKLVKEIPKTKTSEDKDSALRMKNKRGNTPLHLAASLGNLVNCKCIAERNATLVKSRNNEKETPLILAALHGHKEVFGCLHGVLKSAKPAIMKDQLLTYARRGNDGNNVLHFAIKGDFFDLALQIIKDKDLKDLVDYANLQGITPLHLLASKPSSFKSGNRIHRWRRIVYNFISVDNLMVDELKIESENSTTNTPNSENDISSIETSVSNYRKDEKRSPSWYPQNYQTCVDIGRLMAETATVSGSRQQENGHLPTKANKPKDRINHKLLPHNYLTFYDIAKLLSKTMLVFLGLGFTEIKKMKTTKQKNTWSLQIMDGLLHETKIYELYEATGKTPEKAFQTDASETLPYTKLGDGQIGFSTMVQELGKSEGKGPSESKEKPVTTETPLLIAAKNGVIEMVEEILKNFPIAIHDMDLEDKNILLLAVQYRQPDVYQFLLKRNIFKDSLFRQIDKKGNSALHLAGLLGTSQPWIIPGAALQMQWEVKWFQYVEESMPLQFFPLYNNHGETAEDIFSKHHTSLAQAGGEWLNTTATSCSVVAALVATVAFATSTTVPGGLNQETGAPTLENQTMFDVFGIAALIALGFSVTSVVMFLAILTSRFTERDFGVDLPAKLLLGLTSLFVSIAAMLVCFCAGHFFVLKDKLGYATSPIYVITCLPITFFAMAQFPLYLDLIRATFTNLPERSYKVASITSPDDDIEDGTKEDEKEKKKKKKKTS